MSKNKPETILVLVRESGFGSEEKIIRGIQKMSLLIMYSDIRQLPRGDGEVRVLVARGVEAYRKLFLLTANDSYHEHLHIYPKGREEYDAAVNLCGERILRYFK